MQIHSKQCDVCIVCFFNGCISHLVHNWQSNSNFHFVSQDQQKFQLGDMDDAAECFVSLSFDFPFCVCIYCFYEADVASKNQ